MDPGLKDQTVKVTGSSSGIGRAAAIAFGAEGARVATAIVFFGSHANQQITDEVIRISGGR